MLLPITDRGGRPHILFTKKSDAVPHHKGQFSFPGGVCEERDASRVETALREAWEEVRIPPEAVEVLGLLDDTMTRATPFVITPVVGIIREPVSGMESVCPVPLDTRLWICSPDAATANLVHAARVPGEALGPWRTVNLPGLTVTPAEMLDSLERLAGADARAAVRVEIDDRIAGLMSAWPGAFDLERPLALGFTRDTGVDDVVAQFLRFAAHG